ncbi:proline racemase family protein [Streptomyces sp. WAC06614]|uniref:proline racemase family protein n=1 Tax=Streptomyces sp. WAC06614 TaxID=2487416 RepID=UPI0021AF76A7|nr:proline racemase family protein [Streptomyces sp. WAC06614]
MSTAPEPFAESLPAVVRTTDYHTAGEPFRIVDTAAAGMPPVPGDTVAERCATAVGPGGSGTAPRRGPLDDVRRLLVQEPRGHAGMYGGFVVPPDDDGAHFGVLFWHKDGFSTACGHGTMALGAWAVDTGRVPAPADGDASVRIDVPSGRVTATVHRAAGRTTGVTFRNVPARVTARKVPVATSLGIAEVDIAHAGACYASVAARDLGLEVTRAALPDLTRAGREIRAALAHHPATWHHESPLLSGVYGVVLHDELPDTPFGPHQRNVTVFADGQIDRSPCGSGTSARLALLAEDGRLGPGEDLLHESVVGSVFTGRWLGEGITEVTGTAYRTGAHAFDVDPHDALGTGFLL